MSASGGRQPPDISGFRENQGADAPRSPAQSSKRVYLANLFRLYLHSLSANLLVRLRHVVAAPPRPLLAPDLPTEALAGAARRQYFNRRRDADPLGEAHPATWRMRLIKVAAEIVQSSRRIWIRLSGSWPFLDHFQQVCDAISACGRPAQGDTT